MKKPMRFLFFGFDRPWKPMKGFPAPAGRVCEMRSFPGGLVAQGSTPEEVVENLRKTVRATLGHVQNPEAWYEEAVRNMTPEERKDAHELWDRVFFDRQELKQFNGPDDFFGVSSNFEYAAFFESSSRLDTAVTS